MLEYRSVITIFTSPKPPSKDTEGLQREAIATWRHTFPDAQILLLGNDQEMGSLEKTVGAQIVTGVATNENGLPFINSLFEMAQGLASFDRLCFVNSDIAFDTGLRRIVDEMPLRFPIGKKIIVTGLRKDVTKGEFSQITKSILEGSFPSSEWRSSLLKAKPQRQSAFDYFLFRKGTLKNLKPLLLGRPAWDSWLLFQARLKRYSIVDASQLINAWHPIVRLTAKEEQKKWRGHEAKHNFTLSGMWGKGVEIRDVRTHIWTKKCLIKASHSRYFFFRYLSIYWAYLIYYQIKHM